MSQSSTETRLPIRALPALLVNQIAAGEVVDRPASVVKELVENAIDAGATRIGVELEQGGVELIRITDDGCGIPEAELPLAIAPHATSKITRAEDLDRIATMGFRGEALASIASVSRLSLRSRTATQTGAGQIDVEGDSSSGIRPAAGPMGTQVSVRNLFFNTPARRKFLRTPGTEQGHCMDVVSSLAIAHPAIGFRASVDGRVVLDLPPGQGPRERALAVLGRELEAQLLEVDADVFDDARGLALWGLIGRPEIARATAKGQHLFLNGRVIRDKTVQHALREAYRGLIEPGRYPTAVLMIEMDPGAVDVNVHPAKAEVRFRDQSLVHGVILRSVRDALRRADLTPAIATGGASPAHGAGGFGTGLMSGTHDAGAATSRAGEAAPWPAAVQVSAQSLVEYLKRAPAPTPTPEPVRAEVLREALGAPGSPRADAGVPTPVREDRVLQVHNSFVVTQDEQGLLIVDQHALHERVMFEALLARLAPTSETASGGAEGASALESQRLLVPAVVRARREAVGKLGQLQALLARIGVVAEPLGPESVGVHAFPTFLFDRGVDPAEFVGELLDRTDDEDFAPGSEHALHEVLDMMACKAAIKAGDRLSETELRDLLRFREHVERSSNCPHGRPTSIRLTIRELEKRFGRS